MEVWSGNINIDTSSDLKIKLVTTSQRRENIPPKDAKLSLRSLVNPALVPLYARAGPSVELHSTTEETSEWLKSRLLGGIWLDEDDGAIFERFTTIQCPVGLLVGVTSSQTYTSTANNVSDLLIYGILSSSHDESRIRPPSPPGSSSLVGENGSYEQSSKIRRELRIYAAPLATSYAQKVQDIPSPPSSTAGDDTASGNVKDETFANFLPDLRSPSPKRKRILSLFEGAAQHHRRVRHREMMPQLSSKKIKKETDELGSPMMGQMDLRRARSLSLGGSQLSKLSESAGVGDKRPGSSRGMLHRRDSKSRLNLSQVPSGNEPARSQSVVPSPTTEFLKPAPPNDATEPQLSSSPTDKETLMTRNKDLITRTILTCMRLYGYNRKSNRSKSVAAGIREPSHEPEAYQRENSMMPEYASIPVGEEAKQTSSAAEEDDFKAMYHATYRAATFALRHYLKMATAETLPPVLSKDTATNVIDGILKLFCDDQLKPVATGSL